MSSTPLSFLQETQDELRKVVWPTRIEAIRLTAIVIVVSLLVGLFIGGLDFIFTKLLALFIK